MTQFAREYGEGLYALAREEQIERVLLEQLLALYACFKEQPAFMQLLSNASLPKQERLEVLDKSLRGNIHSYILNFLKLLCEKTALHELKGCIDVYRELYNKDMGVLDACVVSGKPLSEERKAKLTLSLEKKTGKRIQLTNRIDPSLLDGILLEMEGQQYDGSLKQRLAGLRQAIIQDRGIDPMEGGTPCS